MINTQLVLCTQLGVRMLEVSARNTTKEHAMSWTAEDIFTAVKAGKTLFTKTASGEWQIIGPAESLVPNLPVEVTKADGTTKTVIVNWTLITKTVRGITYSTATFRSFATVGATDGNRTPSQYDGNSKGSIQIWDN